LWVGHSVLVIMAQIIIVHQILIMTEVLVAISAFDSTSTTLQGTTQHICLVKRQLARTLA